MKHVVALLMSAALPIASASVRADVPAAIDMPVDTTDAGYCVTVGASQCTAGWSFWEHRTGYHGPSPGIGGSDDTHAYDINLNQPSRNSDAGREVYAVADGEIFLAGRWANNDVGQLAIEHSAGWTTGYLHLDVSPGSMLIALKKRCRDGNFSFDACKVSRGQHIGNIFSTGAANDHLHFAVYDSPFRQAMNSVQVTFSGTPANRN